MLVFAHTVALRHLLTFLLLVAFATHCLRSPRNAWPIAAPASAWLVFTFVSCAWSASPELSARAWLDEAFYPLLLFFAFHRLGSIDEAHPRVMLAVWGGMVALGLLSMEGYDAVAVTPGLSGIRYFYPGVGQASSYAVMSLPILLLMLYSHSRGWSVLGAIGLLASVVVGMVSLNRMFWPTATATLFCALAFRSKASIRHPILWAAAAVLATVAIVHVYQIRGLASDSADGPVVSVFEGITNMWNNDPRRGIWRSFSRRAWEHPWIGLGFGKEMPRVYFRAHHADDPIIGGPEGQKHSHNLFLNTMLQTGIIGVALLLWLLGSLVWSFARARATCPQMAWSGIALILAMILKNTTDDFMRDSMAMYFWALAGWQLARTRTLAKRAESVGERVP